MVAAAHLDPVLDDVLDARGANLAEQRLITTSIVEQLLDASPDDISRPLRAQLLLGCRQVLQVNAEEGHAECSAAGRADSLIRAARHAELNGTAHPLTVKEIGRRLRPALAVLKHPDRHHPVQVEGSRRIVHEVLDRLPAHAVFTASVEKELRSTGFALLRDMHAARATP